MVSISQLPLKKQQTLVLVSFLFIPVLLTMIISVYPAFQMIYFSFHEYDGYDTPLFVGLDNYREIFFEDPESLLEPIYNSVYYFTASIIQLILATWFAVIINGKIKGSNLFKALLVMPAFLNTVAVAATFKFAFELDGVLSEFLMTIGLESLANFKWLGNHTNASWSLAASSVWRYLGWNMLIVFGALQSVPKEIYEASEIDGANEWQQFWYITFPLILPVLALISFLSILGSLEVFDIPYLITQGVHDTKSYIMVAMETAFQYNQFGLASALGLVMLFIVAISTALQYFFFKRKGISS